MGLLSDYLHRRASKVLADQRMQFESFKQIASDENAKPEAREWALGQMIGISGVGKKQAGTVLPVFKAILGIGGGGGNGGGSGSPDDFIAPPMTREQYDAQDADMTRQMQEAARRGLHVDPSLLVPSGQRRLPEHIPGMGPVAPGMDPFLPPGLRGGQASTATSVPTQTSADPYMPKDVLQPSDRPGSHSNVSRNRTGDIDPGFYMSGGSPGDIDPGFYMRDKSDGPYPEYFKDLKVVPDVYYGPGPLLFPNGSQSGTPKQGTPRQDIPDVRSTIKYPSVDDPSAGTSPQTQMSNPQQQAQSVSPRSSIFYSPEERMEMEIRKMRTVGDENTRQAVARAQELAKMQAQQEAQQYSNKIKRAQELMNGGMDENKAWAIAGTEFPSPAWVKPHITATTEGVQVGPDGKPKYGRYEYPSDSTEPNFRETNVPPRGTPTGKVVGTPQYVTMGGKQYMVENLDDGTQRLTEGVGKQFAPRATGPGRGNLNTMSEEDKASTIQAVLENPSLIERLTPTQLGKIIPGLRAAGFTNFGKSLPATAVTKIAEARAAIASIGDLRQVLKDNEQYIGPLAGLQKYNPYSDAVKAQADINRVRQRVGKALEGGVLRKEDEEKYKTMLAELTDTPSTAIYKTDRMINELERDMEIFIEEQRMAGKRINSDSIKKDAPATGAQVAADRSMLPSKSGQMMTADMAKKYLGKYGSKDAAREAAKKAGWRVE